MAGNPATTGNRYGFASRLTLFPPDTTLFIFRLFMNVDSLYCKQYGLRSDCPMRSSLIRIHMFASMIKSRISAFEYT